MTWEPIERARHDLVVRGPPPAAAPRVLRARALQRDRRRARRGPDDPLRRQPASPAPTAPINEIDPTDDRDRRAGPGRRSQTSTTSPPPLAPGLSRCRLGVRPRRDALRADRRRRTDHEAANESDTHRRRPCDGRRGESTGVTASMRRGRSPTGGSAGLGGLAARALGPVVPQGRRACAPSCSWRSIQWRASGFDTARQAELSWCL